MALDAYEAEAWYTMPRSLGHETITPPFLYRLGDRDILMTTLSVPVMVKGRFAGIVTADIDLGLFHEMVSGINVFETGHISIISNEGIYVAHPDISRMGQSFAEHNPWAGQYMEDLRSGRGFSAAVDTGEGGKTLELSVPVTIGRTGTPWAALVTVPYDQINASARRFMYSTMLIGLVSLVILFGVVFLITRSITSPLIQGVAFAEKMSQGDFTQHLDIDQKDEIGVLSRVLNQMVRGLGGILKDVKGSVATLNGASDSLLDISRRMAGDADQTSARAGRSDTAVRDMLEAMTELATASEQSTGNLNVVAAAMEEQSATTREVAANISQAFDGFSQVNTQVNRGAEMTREISEEIARISRTARTMADSSGQVMDSARSLSAMAGKMTEKTSAFSV